MATLKEAFEYAGKNPTSDFANNLKQLAGSGSLDQEAKKYNIDLSSFKPVQSQVSRLGTALKDRVGTVSEQVKQIGQAEGALETAAQIGQTPLRVVGQAAGAVGDVIGAGVNAVTGGGLDKLGEYIATTDTGKQLGALLSKFQQEAPELAGTLGDLFNISTVGVGGTAAKPVVSTVVKGTLKGTEKVIAGAKATGGFLKEGISPTPTLGKALEEATVAKTAKEIPAFQKAVSAIDTTGVKTFSDLNKKFKEAIPTISKQVDDELLKDTNVYKIEDLLIPQITKAGNEIKTDYITRALDGLDDLYTKLGDDVSRADIQDLIVKAKEEGFTRFEVNNLARQYNSEYGSKAFTATGDIKQGFNAEVYESTRKGLKDIARGGLGGEQAKALDSSLSAIYDAQRLAERNANAVQAIKTRIEEKGWVGKGIRSAFEASDIITGGAVRALRDTVLARGNAQKLQNVLELESKLKKNLEVINKAMKAKTETEAVKILDTINIKPTTLPTGNNSFVERANRTLKNRLQGGYIANPLAKKELPVSKYLSSGNSSTDLMTEAKKYKSAEEFVKTQGGVGDSIAKAMQKEFELETLTTELSKKANSFSGKGGLVIDTSPEYMQVKSKLNKAMAEYNSFKKSELGKIVQQERRKLPIKVRMKMLKGDIKTKSQLEDIWKQAQGKLPKKQK